MPALWQVEDWDMAKSIQEHLAQRARQAAKELENTAKLQAAFGHLELELAEKGSIYSYSQTICATVKDIGKAIRSIGGNWTKDFSEYAGEFRAEQVVGDCILMLKSEAAPTQGCKVEIVTEEEVVPEHTERRQRFKLTGKCNGWTDPATQAVEAEEVSE